MRHGETTRPDLFHGAESDVELGPAGRLQAAHAAVWLRTHAPQAVYCSTMRRARQTAAIVSQMLGLPDPIPLPSLHERRMASLSGRPRSEGWSIYAETRNRWMAGDLDATHPGGESYRAIAARVIPTFLEIAQRHPGAAVVVVAHGVVIRVLLTSLLQDATPADWERFGIDCAAINALDFDGARWTAWLLNESPTPQPQPAELTDPHPPADFSGDRP
ncbi:MAG: alpha-ribazole phosphatase [Isosphaeraceae bacterium]|jgi:broad specificity phosphatase PhoE|nr:MAG: alpha-ribazole phosphatase [Isosphaeraceae bacterium]